MEFGKWNWRTFERGIEKEWLLTNGIGGFSSSTIIGANTRRYHGLLTASLKPPVKRHLILSKIDENLTVGTESYNLYSYCTPDYIMKGFHHLQRVIVDPIPTFIYSLQDIIIEKSVSMVYGENTVAIVYKIINGGSSASLKLTPLVNFRDYHHNSTRDFLKFSYMRYESGIIVKPDFYNIDINIYCSEGAFISQDSCYFISMDYPAERERGLQSLEDHYIPGYFEVGIKPGEVKTLTLIATVENCIKSTDGMAIVAKERERIQSLTDKAGLRDKLAQKLVAAADNFIVYSESTGAKTIIAGYPWFTDWGRDTMIALPGLTLSTKRFEDAREILYTFSRYVKHGLIPNMFPDEGQEPAYNSVDASLWYFEAVSKFLKSTGEYEFIQHNIYKVLKDIVQSYINGTIFRIKMDEDCLIMAGDQSTQLTWMDAKVGDWVVTPRHGKAVEINALWYNALKVMEDLARCFDEDGSLYSEIAIKIQNSFIASFWNEEKQCLYDVITSGRNDDSVRPNQVIALSLSYPVIEGEKAKRILDIIWKELYTAYGLRSLSPRSEGYKGMYAGDQYHRDIAYHQGTVWTWPLGHFITSYVKIHGCTRETRRTAFDMLKPFIDHLSDACIGSISEIFDGDEPLIPRGCFAQAWSVGEILRAYTEIII